MRRLLILALGGSLATLLVVAFFALQSPASDDEHYEEIVSLPAPTITPSVISPGEKTEVTITVLINNATLRDPRIQYLDTDDGREDTEDGDEDSEDDDDNDKNESEIKWKNFGGKLRDDGKKGDEVAGDRVFTLVREVKRKEPGRMHLRVHAHALPHKDHIVHVSETTILETWPLFQDVEQGFSVLSNPNFVMTTLELNRPGFLQGTFFRRPEHMLNLSLASYDNPSLLPLVEWYQTTLADNEYAFADGATRVVTRIYVNNMPALRVDSTLLGHRKMRTFFANGYTVVGLEISVPDNVAIPNSYFVMVTSFSLRN